MVADIAQRLQVLSNRQHLEPQRPAPHAQQNTQQNTQQNFVGHLLDLSRTLVRQLEQLEQQLEQQLEHQKRSPQLSQLQPLETLLHSQLQLTQQLLQDSPAPQPSPAVTDDDDTQYILRLIPTATATKAPLSLGQLAQVLPFKRDRRAADTPSELTWEDQLLSLGRQLQNLRQTQGMSLLQLHAQSLVPLYHLRALEEGRLGDLPEPLFVYGFVQRIGRALGADGIRLVTQLPNPEIQRRAVGTWQTSPKTSVGGSLRPIHLYAGYAALMTGAIGGLTGALQSSDSSGAKVSLELLDATVTAPVVQAKTTKAPKTTQKASLQQPLVGQDLAPPEQGRPE